MPKIRKPKRKVPVTAPAVPRAVVSPSSSNKPSATRAVIRRFHILIKRQTRLRKILHEASTSTAAGDVQKELAEIGYEIHELGGLEAYQKMSAIGQGNDRGGGSEKVLLEFLTELGHGGSKGQKRWKVLEVGALKPDNYASCSSWMDVTPIDLHSRHPNILEQDFLKMDETSNRERWDLISLSLVVNFVPDAKDRGRMLRLAHTMLRDSGFLYLVLPLPCVTNSRYMSPEHLIGLMEAVSFQHIKSRWREGGKIAYWLFRKVDLPKGGVERTKYAKKIILRTGDRNNFCILL